MNLTEYQKGFQEKLPEEYKQQFDEVIKLADSSKSIEEFVKALPAGFGDVLKGITTIDAAVNAVFEASDWGTVEYAPPKSVSPKKAAKPAIKAPAVKPAAGAIAAPGEQSAKRKGNIEALRKAREARGLKSPEQIEKDRVVVVAAIKDYLKGKDVVHVKKIVLDLIPTLKGKGSDGKDLSESFIYTTLTAVAKDPNAGIARSDMDKRQIGYKIA